MARSGEGGAPRVGAAFERGRAILRARSAASLLLAFALSGAPGAVVARFTDPLWDALDAPGALLLVGLLVAWAMALNVVLAGAMGALASGTPIADVLRATVRALPRLLLAAPLVGMATAIGFALLVVPGVLLWSAWAAVGPVLVVERRGVRSALRRSRALTRDVGREVRAVLLATALLALAASSAIEVAAGLWWHGLDAFLGDAPLPTPPVGYLLAVAGAHAPVDAWVGATVAALFLTLRERAEGPAPDRLRDIFA